MEKVFPFLWLHGEPHDIIEEEIQAIYDANLRAFCIESRVHPDFCGEGWWKDLDFILEKAQALNMQVWILDDKSYPTGIANGALMQFPELRQRHIAARNCDIMGGVQNKALIKRLDGDILLGAYAIPHTDNGFNFGELIDLTDRVKGDFIFFDLEKKMYRFITVWETLDGSERAFYIDAINQKSVKILLDTVYEPHNKHYKKYFGNVLQGFFSDEPRLGNGYNETSFKGTYAYSDGMGKIGLAYPFSCEVDKRIKKTIAGFTNADYLSLWYDTGEKGGDVRCVFMDIITDLYQKNFSKQIGTWCREHSVKYAGHIIEDMNAHVHTVCGAGHYFKSQAGQDMAGIDIVLHQIKPYSNEYKHIAPISGGYADADFFNFTLPALAKSSAILDIEKQGNALCEIYGAYGFGESIQDMKWLTDLMLCGGINHFIPHAFSPPKDDDDCPPHFYVNNQNPLYEGFSQLMKYLTKLSDLLSGGEAEIDTAVLYHAEADWSGKSYMPVDTVIKYLAERQRTAIIVPWQKLKELKRLKIKHLIVPYAEFRPECVKKALDGLHDCNVIYIGKKIPPALINELGPSQLVMKSAEKNLRFYHYVKDNENIYMLFNAGLETIRQKIRFHSAIQTMTVVDYINRISYDADTKNGFELLLLSGASLILKEKPEVRYETIEAMVLSPVFKIYKKQYFEKQFRYFDETAELFDINGERGDPNFSGTVKYQFDVEISEKGEYALELQEVGCAATMTVNGEKVGTRIFRPFFFDISDYLKTGKNTIEIDISNTLANAKKDELSIYSGLEYFGLMQKPVLKSIRKLV